MNNIEKWLRLENFEKTLNIELNEALSNGKYKISLNEFYVLYFLNKSNGNSLSISELSEKNGLSLSATSRMLVKFEKNCEVIDRKQGTDKRSVVITLTDKGKEYLEDSLVIIEKVLQNYENLLKQFDWKLLK